MEHLSHPRLAPTRDHVVPQSMGGRIIIIACIQCNMIKADMTPDQWESFMAAHPQWWRLTMHQLRMIRRQIATPGLAAGRNDRREAKLRKQRQGSAPATPVVVPPGLIWTDAAAMQFERESRAEKRKERMRTITPELIAATVAEDAKLRV